MAVSPLFSRPVADLGWLKDGTLLFAAGVEAAAALVIGLAAVEATLRSLLLFVPGQVRPGQADPKEALRLRLGRWLAVALELELGADILRTALNFFLQQEIDRAEARSSRPTRPG